MTFRLSSPNAIIRRKTVANGERRTVARNQIAGATGTRKKSDNAVRYPGQGLVLDRPESKSVQVGTWRAFDMCPRLVIDMIDRVLNPPM